MPNWSNYKTILEIHELERPIPKFSKKRKMANNVEEKTPSSFQMMDGTIILQQNM
jgi:hypothetical protein